MLVKDDMGCFGVGRIQWAKGCFFFWNAERAYDARCGESR
jgi:hypothetical protein